MNKKPLLILCLILALVLIGAGALYNSLAGSVQLGGLVTTPTETQAPTQVPTETAPEEPTETTDTQPTEPSAHIAPDFTMLDKEGNEVTLASFFGKPIVLNFWASWCGPCKMEMPEIQKFYEQYGEEIHFLLVSVDESLDTAKTFITDSDAHYLEKMRDGEAVFELPDGLETAQEIRSAMFACLRKE